MENAFIVDVVVACVRIWLQKLSHVSLGIDYEDELKYLHPFAPILFDSE